MRRKPHRWTAMTRIALKLLVSAALVAGVCVATVGGLSAGSADLPAAPTAAAAGSPAVTDADGNLVVDLKDWQQTRLKGKTSNTIP